MSLLDDSKPAFERPTSRRSVLRAGLGLAEAGRRFLVSPALVREKDHERRTTVGVPPGAAAGGEHGGAGARAGGGRSQRGERSPPDPQLPSDLIDQRLHGHRYSHVEQPEGAI